MIEQSVKVHAGIWVALIVAAFFTAGPTSFASCWPIVLVYFPLIGFLLAAIAILSLIVFAVITTIRKLGWHTEDNADRAYVASKHGLILVGGLSACALAAYMSAGRVSCL